MATTYINGGTGNDIVDGSGTGGPVQIQGRAGDDTVTGGASGDKLYGNEGNDVLIGGAGADSLQGGAGADTFVISRADLGTGKDALLDFEGAGDGALGGDVIRFTGFSAAATISFVRLSGDDYIYLIRDGDVSGEIAVRHAADVRLTAGDYVFASVIAPPANRAPVGGNDTATIAASASRTLTLSATTLLANDSDPDGQPLRITGVGTAAHGTVILNTNGTPDIFSDDTITYTAEAGYAGADTFTYTLSDGALAATASVAVTVNAPVTTLPLTYQNGGAGNDVIDTSGATGPQQIQGKGGDDTLTGGMGADKLYGGDGNDVLSGGAGADTFTGGLGADTFVIARADLNGGAESITDFEGAGDGGLSGGDVLRLTGFGAGASLTFVRQTGRDHIYEIRDGDFVGQLKVAYDGAALLAAGDYLFTPAGAPANHAPVLAAPLPGAATVVTRTNAIVTGMLPATDGDGDAVRFTVLAGPAHGALKLSDTGAYIYAPLAGYSGGDAFRVRLDDGKGGLSEAVVSVSVAASSADPTPWRDTSAANARVFVQREGTSGSFYVAADQARVTKDGAVVVDWTSGAILGLPQGDGYVLETVTSGITSSRPLSVGDVVVATGQSNMEGWFNTPGASRPPESGIYLWMPARDGTPGQWSLATGAGAIAFADTLRLAEPGVPVAFVTGAVGGTKLLPATNVAYWLATGTGSLYQNTVDQVAQASHGQAALLLWNQGEADSASRVDPLLYAEGMKTLFARFDADIAPDRIIISGLAFTRGNADALRAAQASVATADGHILYVPTSPAIETIDTTHLSVPSRILQASDTALALLAAKGMLPSGIARQAGSTAADVLTGTALSDIVQGGGGNDTVTGANGDDIIRGEDGADNIRGDAGNDALSGGLDNDRLDGGAGHDDVFGDDGNDLLYGGLGNDMLDGGTGADSMFGQAGDDTYVVDSAADIVTEVTGEGTDTVIARVAYALTAFVENLIIDGLEALSGAGNALANFLTGNDAANLLSGLGGNDSINGGPGNDTLDGGDGNDTLTGGSGIDAFTGGAGDDTFYVEQAGETVAEAAGGGTDTIISTITYTLPDNVEALVLGGRSPIDAFGSATANSLTGNVNGNLLDGGGGNDRLMGLAGNDILRGGSGNDKLEGGDSSDILIGGLGADTLTGDASKHSQDRFVFESLGDMGLGAGNRDTITDFDSQDLIDLSLIDAITGLSGDQAFSFIGTAAFSAAGQVRYSVVSGGLLIELNTDGNLAADADLLLLNPLATPDLSDFLL